MKPVVDPTDWLAKRVWSYSGNKVLHTKDDDEPLPATPITTLACQIYQTSSAEEASRIVKSSLHNNNKPISVVSGGHEFSNVATVASHDAIVLDMIKMKDMTFHGDDNNLVTIGAGVVFQELVEAVRVRQRALPVGTGPTIGVIGYIVNGGLSGYFSRRLGLLGQSVTQMTVVLASGEIRILKQNRQEDEDLFVAMLGAGSALGIVIDVTIRMHPESVVRSAEQLVIGYETMGQAQEFSKQALRFLRDSVLPNESVSMEVVVAHNAIVVTMIFYDTFDETVDAYIGPLQDLAASLGLAIVAQSHWTNWYEVASALWPVIEATSGDPLVGLQHCVGTKIAPTDSILDRCTELLAMMPYSEAPLSLVEVRTLGGAAGSAPFLPTGNCRHVFFIDFLVIYDAKNKSLSERQLIADRTREIVESAKHVDGLTVDFSGTHSQPDDPAYVGCGDEMWGGMSDKVRAMKEQVDPLNRFRFHPFVTMFS